MSMRPSWTGGRRGRWLAAAAPIDGAPGHLGKGPFRRPRRRRPFVSNESVGRPRWRKVQFDSRQRAQ